MNIELLKSENYYNKKINVFFLKSKSKKITNEILNFIQKNSDKNFWISDGFGKFVSYKIYFYDKTFKVDFFEIFE